MKKKDFEHFILRQLVPLLRKGQLVCMDNVNTHKNTEALHAIKDAGARVLFLPPYSPDLNPIEAAWAKLKHLVRKSFADDVNVLKNALRKAWSKINPSDVRGWFRYCGYL